MNAYDETYSKLRAKNREYIYIFVEARELKTRNLKCINQRVLVKEEEIKDI